MVHTLSNGHLHFSFDASTSTWGLYPQAAETPFIEGARVNGRFRFSIPDFNHLNGLRPWQWRGWLDDAHFETRVEAESPHGPLAVLTADARTGLDVLGVRVEFALPRERPFLLIRLTVRNQGRTAFQVDRLNPLFAGPLHHTGLVRLSPTPAPLTFFSNGWQSWSFAGALTANQHQPTTWLKPIQGPVIQNPQTPVPDYKGQFASDMFGVLACPGRRTAIVAGFIAQREQFGSVDVVTRADQPSLRLRAHADGVQLNPGAELRTDWAYVQLLDGYGNDPLQEFAEAAGRENGARLPGGTGSTVFDASRAGWCSWYEYFNKVGEQDMRANLAQVVNDRERLPLQLVQLDDGFEANIGDWFEQNAKFPAGLKSLAEAIRRESLVPGLWLAPFVARPDAQLGRDHPDWLIRNPVGLKANAGFVFNSFSHGLDVTHPGVQEHTLRLIQKAVEEWGFPYLKLDFLYAAALPGRRYDRTRTRAQAMRLGLEVIREAAGADAFLVGCGCPLGSAIGLVDAMRVGPDVDARWRPKYGVSLPFYAEPGMPSARNSIRNTLARAPLHRRWWLNDPDCLIVREGTELTTDEVTALATVIALSGGLLVLSDDLTRLTPERRRLVEPLMPVLNRGGLGSDWLEREIAETVSIDLDGPAGPWRVVGLFNWSERERDREVELPGEAHVLDFWGQRYQRSTGRYSARLAPHSAHLLAVRPVADGPGWVGSSLHFSQGAELQRWQLRPDGVTLTIDLSRTSEGYIYLSLPGVVPTTGERVTGDIYRFPVQVAGRSDLAVEWRPGRV